MQFIQMYTNAINNILGRSPITRPYFTGCFAADKIPSILEYPCCMVVNTDCSGWEGSHWVAIFAQSKQTVEYYDSLGQWPPISPYITKFLDQFPNRVYNSKQLQADHSVSCGKHAIYFLYMRCLGSISGIDDMIKLFSKRKQRPDAIVNDFVRRLMDIQ